MVPAIDKVLTAAMEGIDMDLMADTIKGEIMSHLNRLETSPHDYFAMACVGDHISGMGSTIEDMLQKGSRMKALQTKDEAFWKELVAKWFINRPRVEVVGIPSIKLSEDNEAAENARVEAQKAKIMTEEGGLEKYGAALDEVTPYHCNFTCA